MEKTKEQTQQEIIKFCKVCKQDRMFVTSLSLKTDLICTQCGYRQSLTPFKMITDNFGFKFINGEKEQDKK